VENANREVRERPENLADDVNHLAGEVKLLAINLAITLAKLQSRKNVLRSMERHFTELIKKANDTSQQVSDALSMLISCKRINAGLPASTEVIEKRGAYDSIEAKLNYVYKLSREVLETLKKIKRQEQAG
jgi:hypothetical protein